MIDHNKVDKYKIQALLVLAAINFLAHFLLIKNFGFYYDDYFILGWSEQKTIYPFWKKEAILSGWGDGRPISHFMRSILFSQLDNPFIGLFGMYVINLVLQVGIAFAFYLLFKKRVSEEFARPRGTTIRYRRAQQRTPQMVRTNYRHLLKPLVAKQQEYRRMHSS